MKVSEMLKAGRALIDTPDKWTQHAAARRHGSIVIQLVSCAPQDYEAVCFCSVGALQRVKWDYQTGGSLYGQAFGYLISEVGRAEFSLVRFNDTRTHAEVLAVWDAAIKKAEEDETK